MNILTALSPILTITNVVFLAAVSIGIFMAYRYGFSKTVHDMQTKLIDLLKTEVETLKRQQEEAEEESRRMDMVLATVSMALKKKGITLSVNNETVELTETRGRQMTTQTTALPKSMKKDKEETS